MRHEERPRPREGTGAADATGTTFLHHLVLDRRARVVAYPEPLVDGVLYGFESLGARLRRRRPVVFMAAGGEAGSLEGVADSLPPRLTSMTVRVAGRSVDSAGEGSLGPLGEWAWHPRERLLLVYGGIEGSGLFFSRRLDARRLTIAHWSFDPGRVRQAGLWIARQLHERRPDAAARWASGFGSVDAGQG